MQQSSGTISAMLRSIAFVLSLSAFAAMVVYSQRLKPQTTGKLENGAVMLNTGWTIRPAGKQIPLSTLPMSAAMAPDGRMLAVLNAGYLPASVQLLDMKHRRALRGYTNEAPRVPLSDNNPARSERLDFSQSDIADDAELSDIL